MNSNKMLGRNGTSIELTDIYDDTRMFSNRRGSSAVDLAMEPRGSSVKSTPRSFIAVPSPLKVAQNAPHFLNSKRKLFCRMIAPFILLSVIQMYYIWKDCHAAFEKVDNEGVGHCFNLLAEVLNMCFFISTQIACYQIRKELIQAAPVIFSFVEQLNPRDVEKLRIKNQNEWVNVLTGKQEKFRAWNIRGYVLLPVGLFFVMLAYFLNIYIITEEEECPAASFGCGPDDTIVFGTPGLISFSVRYSFGWFMVLHAIMSAVYPFVLVCLIVGPSAKSRIGLWNQFDVSLDEVQTLSMHFSLYLSVVTFLLLLTSFFFNKYFNMTLSRLVLYVFILTGALVAVLFLPIVPVIFALKDIKGRVINDVSALEERANKNFLDLLRIGTEERLNPGEVERAEAELGRIAKYRSQVQDANVVPSSIEVIRTICSSLFVGVVVPIAMSRAFKAA